MRTVRDAVRQRVEPRLGLRRTARDTTPRVRARAPDRQHLLVAGHDTGLPGPRDGVAVRAISGGRKV